MKHNQDFGGSLNDIETMKQAGISKKTFTNTKQITDGAELKIHRDM